MNRSILDLSHPSFPAHEMLPRIDLTVILAIIVCCAFLPLHLIGGGATILLSVSVACMALVVVLTVVRRRWNSRRITVYIPFKSPTSSKIFHCPTDVDDGPFWSPTHHPALLDSSTCVICLNSMSGTLLSSNCCNNLLHQECMRTYIFHNQQTEVCCPICRSLIRIQPKVSV
jgi:hypothetical protein